jgi:predicted RND superfamily exporter protein
MNSFVFTRRTGLLVLAVAAFLAPITVLGVVRAIRSNANDVRDWLPAHYPETTNYRKFQKYFGSEDFVVVSWPGCTLADPRLNNYSDALNEHNQAAARESEPLFTQVTTGRDLIWQLTSAPTLLTREQAIERLTGTVVGPDGEQSCAVLTLSEPGRRDLHRTLATIAQIATEVGVPATDVHLGGPPVVNAAIDRSSTQSLVRLAGLAAIIGVVVAWACFRSVRLTVIVFVISAYSATLSLAVVPLCGQPLNAILVTMVPLVYVAAMSGAIHLTNYYLDALREGHGRRAIGHALMHAALPLGLAAGTTAIGLLSLLYSDLAPIRMFGVFSAVGVGIALLMQFVLLPALLAVWPGREVKPGHRRKLDASVESDGTAPLAPFWQRLAQGVIDRQAGISAALLLVLAGGAVGLTRMETSIQIMRLFAPHTPIIASYGWLEEKLGALVPMEVVLRFEGPPGPDMAHRLHLITHVEEAIETLPDVSGSLSAATLAPAVTGKVRGSLRAFVINRGLSQARVKLIEGGYLAEGENEELWRISVRVGAVSDIDYGAFQRELEAKVQPLLTAENAAGTRKVTAVYTGAVPIIYKARRSLLDGLIFGFGTDVALIVIAMIVLTRYATNGVLIFLACIFPMAIVFGSMGWLGIVVDIGSVMTPCVALGVTVDDVIHFVLWFRRGIERGRSVPQAVMLAYEGCGRAMVQSWGVIGLGLAAFALSTFIPTFRFGALMIALLTVGLVGNLLFLPALLAGPLGRAIAGQIQRRAARKSVAAAKAVSDPGSALEPSQPKAAAGSSR